MNVDISDIVRQVEPVIGKFTQQMIDDFKVNLLQIFRTSAAARIKDALMGAYDELADFEESQMGARVRGKDPTSLKTLRSLFERQISDELNTLTRVEGDILVIEVMDKRKLGFTEDVSQKKGFPDTADTLAYYIMGIAGAFAFITPEHYEKMRGRKSSIGRTGLGFMIPFDRYKSEGWERKTGIPFSDVQHSISGQRPYTGFNEALAKIDYSSYIQQALEKTQQSFQGRKLP